MPTNWRRVAVFLVVTFAFSWAQWLLVVAAQQEWIGAGRTLTPLAIFGPLIGALAVSTNRQRLARLAATLVPRAPGILILALLLPAAVFAIALLISSSASSITNAVPALPTIAIVFAGMFVTAGIGEEIGWRGFLLPELRRSLSANSASALIAVIWFCWHLPLEWVRGSTQSDLPLAAFALGLASYSFITTWLTERASSLAAILFHASANTVFWLALGMTKETPAERMMTNSFVATMLILAAAAGLSMRNAHTRTPDR